ncbi:MAG: M15 family metallopeptidase [Myxococcota bacterium]
MRREWKLLLGAAAVALPGGALVAGAWWLWRRAGGMEKGSVMTGARIHNRHRADGMRAELRAFLDWWEAHGPFPLQIPPLGGLRTDAEQAALYAQGRTAPGARVTNAATARDTPHGRGAALDVYPVREVNFAGGVARIWTGDESDPAERAHARALLARVGEAAEARGLVWGGRWNGLEDLPHLELPNWLELPMPGGVA